MPKELWQLSDIYVQEITEEQKKVLSDWELLPCSLKRVCQRLPEQVLEARVQDTLPVLMVLVYASASPAMGYLGFQGFVCLVGSVWAEDKVHTPL